MLLGYLNVRRNVVCLIIIVSIMFDSYNPSKYADRDDDLSDMEANFDDIMKEERRR